MMLWVGMLPDSSICATDWLTIHGLDFGIPAEMTAFLACPDFVYKDEISGLRPCLAISCLAVLREDGASKTPFPSSSFTALS